jgi:hypothetical protein
MPPTYGQYHSEYHTLSLLINLNVHLFDPQGVSQLLTRKSTMYQILWLSLLFFFFQACIWVYRTFLFRIALTGQLT